MNEKDLLIDAIIQKLKLCGDIELLYLISSMLISADD